MVRLALHHAAEVLDDHRHAGERTDVADGGRLGDGCLVARVDDCVDLRVDPLRGLDRGVDQFAGGDLTAAHQVGLGSGVE